LIPLLNAVIERGTAPRPIIMHARKLLDAFGATNVPAAPPSIGAVGLVEGLTPREMEVLQLLSAGDPNRTIAEKLFITVRTVKKHTSNIYGKLNVNSRTQAIARARELGLLLPD
jgi:LuxR family maltose regulon positive regulatory protein